MKEIPLTQGMVALVDDEDYERLMKHKWHYRQGKRGLPGRAVRNVYMHREIISARPSNTVDHIDHNSLNNRKSNLRLCNTSQNSRNRSPHRGCTSQYKGVSWFKVQKRWAARIRLWGKRRFLGYFDDETEAARTYDKAAKRLFGEFACLNFPETEEGHDIA